MQLNIWGCQGLRGFPAGGYQLLWATGLKWPQVGTEMEIANILSEAYRLWKYLHDCWLGGRSEWLLQLGIRSLWGKDRACRQARGG